MSLNSHPLAINIRKFQIYNFDFFTCQEVVLFETLVVLGGISFAKKEEFFHSTETLIKKTGIKRHTVNKILNKFNKKGIIEFEVKGMPRDKYFKLKWANIIKLLPHIYQFDEYRKLFNESEKQLIEFFKQLYENDKEKNNNKTIKVENKKENQDEGKVELLIPSNDAKDLIAELNEIFLERLRNFNKRNGATNPLIKFPVQQENIKRLAKALMKTEEKLIKNAFYAYSDDILDGGVEVKSDAFNYFLKEKNGEYTIISKYITKYINNYSSITEKKFVRYIDDRVI